MLKKIFSQILLFHLIASVSNAQSVSNSADTLQITLPEAEQIVLANNLSIAAAKYGIDINKAYLLQAKLWDNPNLTVTQNIYDGHWLKHGKENGEFTGQWYVQVEQIIRTAGKRSKLANIASTSVTQSEIQFQDLLRSLRFAIRNNFYQLSALLTTRNTYTSELIHISQLLKGMSQQYNSGNISQKEYLRLQALEFSLRQALAGIDSQINSTQSDIRILLQANNNTFIKPATILPTEITEIPSFDAIYQTALQYNPEYLFEKTQLQLQKNNYVYQKALSVPDITLSPEFDHNSSYKPNIWGLGVSLPIPLLNKNQGNIKAARLTIQLEETMVKQQENKLFHTVQSNLNELLITGKNLQQTDSSYLKNYAALVLNALESFKNRQISLIEFIDLFESWRDTQIQYLQLQLNYQLAKENLNYSAGKDVIN